MDVIQEKFDVQQKDISKIPLIEIEALEKSNIDQRRSQAM